MQDYSRRTFLFLGLGLLSGCASNKSTTPLPDAPWQSNANRRDDASRRPANTNHTRVDSKYDLSHPREKAVHLPTYALPAGVLPRTRWATGNLIPIRMDKMAPIVRVTVHHDGMTPFLSSTEASSKARLDAIRRGHQGRGWGDIGYHYVVDRAGRIWEGRPLKYQGAHVRDHNVGNIGIMCMGNFERQSPSEAQLNGLEKHLKTIIRAHNIVDRNIVTHQELAATACPGRNLQRFMVNIRHNGHLA